MNEPKPPLHTEETGEGIYALTPPAPGQDQNWAFHNAVAFISQRPVEGTGTWSEWWVYSDAYVEPSLSGGTPVETYQFTYVLGPVGPTETITEFATALRQFGANHFASGEIRCDTHVVTRQILEP